MANNTIINGGAKPNPVHVGPAPICSFSDGALDAPLKSLKFYVAPSQDLHGYSYPWPAGGGKNKLDVPSRSVSTSVQSESTIYPEGCTVTKSGETVTAVVSGPWAKVRLAMDTSKLVNGQQYTFSAQFTNTGGGTIGLGYYDTTWRGVKTSTATSVRLDIQFTYSSSMTTFILGLIINNTGTSTGNTVVVEDIMLEAGGSVTAYAPYSNICPISGWSQVDGKQSGADMSDYTPITISLGQTVYGGTVDALAGKLVIDRKFITIDNNSAVGMESASWANTNVFYISLADHGVYPGPTTVSDFVSNYVAPTTYNDLRSTTTHWKGALTANGTYYEWTAPQTSVADMKTFLQSNPMQVAYALKTPIEVDLTPVSVNSLLGQNNIWANTGETELDYYPAAASLVAVQNRSSKVYTSIPLGKIRYETYQITPQQAIDLDSYRAETGTLIRNVVGSKCKLEFNTPIMSDSEWNAVWNIISAGFNNNTEKKLKLRYYDTLSASFKTGYFYVPDVQTQIMNVDEVSGKVMYSEIRVAFIEY